MKGFETARTWTSDDLTKEFEKWQAMHGDSVQHVYADHLEAMEKHLVGMEQVIGELKGL